MQKSRANDQSVSHKRQYGRRHNRFSGTISSEQHSDDLSLQTVAHGATKGCDRLKHNMPDTHHRATQTEQDDGPLAGFDLRHAVIYAEILKPKFGPQSED